MTIAALPQILLVRRAGEGLLALPPQRSSDDMRVVYKLVALLAATSILAVAYWLLPEYKKPFYTPGWEVAKILAPWFAFLTVPYLYYVDKRMAEPQDDYWAVGRLLVTGRLSAPKPVIGQFALGWLVKGFFLPLMFGYTCAQINEFTNRDVIIPQSSKELYHFIMDFIWIVDGVLPTLGYALTMRILGTHIRSVDPTPLGWVTCILPYEPIWNGIRASYFEYGGGGALSWSSWLSTYPIVQAVWGIILLGLVVFYGWTTVTFGLRFSNLTHRGILTDGPYRLTKHPHYISKNVFWWLSSVPFLSTNGAVDALRNSLLLALVSVLYFVRAWTEERHLACDSDYVRYAIWMEDNGIFRWIPSLIPALSFFRLHSRETTGRLEK